MINWLKGIDQAIADAAAKRADGYARAGQLRNVRLIRSAGASDNARAEAIDRIMRTASMRAMSADEQAKIRPHVEQSLQTRTGRNEAASTPELIAEMNRGLGGYMHRGPLEAIEGLTATNPTVRRTGLVSAGLGAGAAMTAGAQQLLALMGFMQEGQQTQARAEESPMTQA